MALNEQQKSLLDQMKSDPAFRKAAAAFVLADEQSKKLDEAGVNRKSVDAAKAQKADVDGKFINPTARNVMDLVLGENPTVTDDTQPEPEKELKAEGDLPVEDEETEDDTVPDGGEGDPKEEDKKKSVASLTFEDLAETVKEYTSTSINKALVDSPVMRSVVDVIGKMSKRIAEQDAEIAALRSGEVELKMQHETPRYVLKRMLGLNEVPADDPLVQKANAAVESDNIFQSIAGFPGQ